MEGGMEEGRDGGKQERLEGGMEGQSPVVWEWSSALHRGWRFPPPLTTPPPHPSSSPQHNPLTSSPLTPPSLIKRFSCTIEVVVVVVWGLNDPKYTIKRNKLHRINKLCP